MIFTIACYVGTAILLWFAWRFVRYVSRPVLLALWLKRRHKLPTPQFYGRGYGRGAFGFGLEAIEERERHEHYESGGLTSLDKP